MGDGKKGTTREEGGEVCMAYLHQKGGLEMARANKKITRKRQRKKVSG